MKKNLSNLDKRYSDLFNTGTYGNIKAMENPHNILWVLENCYHKENKNELIDKTHLHINENKKFILNGIYNFLIQEEIICASMINLVEQGLDLKTKNNCSAVIRKNSILILKTMLENGFDINVRNKENANAFESALSRSSVKIQKFIWNHADFNKNALNSEGYNYAFLSVKYNNFEIAREILQTNPEQFLEITNEKSFLQYLLEKNNTVTTNNLSGTKKEIYFKFVDDVFKYIYENKPALLEHLDSDGKSIIEKDFFKLRLIKNMAEKLDHSLKSNEIRKTIKI